MGLETGDQISDLNDAWPLGTDPTSQGDNHIRLVKTVITSDVVSRTEGGTFTGDVAFTQRLDLQAGLDVAGTSIFGSSMTIGNDIPFRTETALGGNIVLMRVDPTDILTFGDTALLSAEYLVTSAGRHDFFCGGANLDYTVDSDGTYSFGSNGVNSNNNITAGATIDPNTLAVAGGTLMGRGSSNSYLANMEADGDLSFRQGGNSGAFEVGKFSFTGDFSTIGSGTFGAQAVVGTAGNADAFLANPGVANISFRAGGVTGGDEVASISAAGAFAANGGGDFGDVVHVETETNEGIVLTRGADFANLWLHTASESFRIGDKVDATAFRFDPVAVPLSAGADSSVATRGKGDARWVRISTFEALQAQLVALQAQVDALP
jgi:hypothetical protein